MITSTSPTGRRVAQLLASAFTVSLMYTVLTTLLGRAPSNFDATTPTVWVGYVGGATLTALALREERWARWAVTAMLTGFLLSTFLVYPHYFTPSHQDVLGWAENDSYTALLAIAFYEHVRRRSGRGTGARSDVREVDQTPASYERPTASLLFGLSTSRVPA